MPPLSPLLSNLLNSPGDQSHLYLSLEQDLMMHAPTNVKRALSTLALSCAAMFWMGCQGQLSEQPPIHPNWNMDQTTRVDPQEPNKFFKDGRGMRKPVTGKFCTTKDGKEIMVLSKTKECTNEPVEKQITVARPYQIASKNRDSRFLRADKHFYKGYKMVKGIAGMESQFFKTLPKQVTLNAALLKRGQERFDIYCAVCHGYSGNGRGIVTLYEKSFMPRNLHGARARGLSVGEIYKTIAEGAGKMNSLGSAIPPRDRWAIVAYVRALQLARISTPSAD